MGTPNRTEEREDGIYAVRDDRRQDSSYPPKSLTWSGSARVDSCRLGVGHVLRHLLFISDSKTQTNNTS